MENYNLDLARVSLGQKPKIVEQNDGLDKLAEFMDEQIKKLKTSENAEISK